MVLALALIFFAAIDDNPSLCFELIAYVCTIVGISTSIFYLCTVNEIKLSNASHECMEKLKKILEEQRFAHENQDNITKPTESLEGDMLSQFVKDISKHP